MGLRIDEVPTVWVDQAGSKVSTRRDSVHMLLSALRLWLHLRVLPIPAVTPTLVDPVAGDVEPRPLASVGS